MTNKKIIILAHPRSGSTALSKILCCHPQIKILNEPFNKGLQLRINSKFAKKLNKIKDIKSLNNFLNYIHKDYNGFKTLFGTLNKKLEEHLFLRKDYKIIILTRKNLLKSAVSSMIALKIGVWGVSKENPIEKIRKKVSEKITKPFSINEIKEIIKKRKKDFIYHKNLLQKNKCHFFELYYEDLFDFKIPLKEKLKEIKEIIEFLGYEKITDEKILEKIELLLDFDKGKVNSKETYESIPNIFEIQTELGSCENGYLFEDNLNIARVKLENIKKSVRD